MSLANILRTKKPESIDIVSIIDKQCANKKPYSFERIKECINALKVCADKEEVNNDEFMFLFFSLYDEVYAEHPRGKGVFHPSSIMGECERKMYFEFMKFEETDEVIFKPDGKLQRTFDVGTWWHTYIQMCLWKAGILEQAEVLAVNRRKRIRGRCDGIVKIRAKRYLIEIKSMNSFSYAKGKLKPFNNHKIQAGVYAKTLGIDNIIFIYVNKDTSEMISHVVQVEESLVSEAEDKMNEVLTSVQDQIAPKRIHCTSLRSPMAKKCPYATRCFKGKRLTT